MRLFFHRTIGTLLVAAAIGGLIFSIAGLFSTWLLKESINESLLTNLTLVDGMLQTTSAGLVIADQSLQTSIASMGALRDTIEATAQTLEATTPLVDALTTLTQDDLPNSVEAAQTSLVSAQESAQVIDSVLTALASIPFVPRDIYDPPVPLHVALEQVSESMDQLPASLQTIEESLVTASDNLEIIQADIDLMAEDIDEIQNSLEEAQGVITEYEALVEDMQLRVNLLETRIPQTVDLLAIMLTFIFVWVAISQFGMLLQGLDFLKHRHEEH